MALFSCFQYSLFMEVYSWEELQEKYGLSERFY